MRIEQPAPIMDPFSSSVSLHFRLPHLLINKMGPDSPPMFHVPTRLASNSISPIQVCERPMMGPLSPDEPGV
jgi:hypothetical protein